MYKEDRHLSRSISLKKNKVLSQGTYIPPPIKIDGKDIEHVKNFNVGTDKWEELANDRNEWRSSLYKNLKERERQFLRKPK